MTDTASTTSTRPKPSNPKTARSNATKVADPTRELELAEAIHRGNATKARADKAILQAKNQLQGINPKHPLLADVDGVTVPADKQPKKESKASKPKKSSKGTKNSSRSTKVVSSNKVLTIPLSPIMQRAESIKDWFSRIKWWNVFVFITMFPIAPIVAIYTAFQVSATINYWDAWQSLRPWELVIILVVIVFVMLLFYGIARLIRAIFSKKWQEEEAAKREVKAKVKAKRAKAKAKAKAKRTTP